MYARGDGEQDSGFLRVAGCEIYKTNEGDMEQENNVEMWDLAFLLNGKSGKKLAAYGIK